MSSSHKQLTWHHQTPEEVMHTLSTSKEGLSVSEARDRLDEYGENALPQKPPRSKMEILLAQFAGPLMIILVLAAGASLVLLEWLDVGVIMAAILLNVILGFVEEYKADQSLEKLKSFLPQNVRVRRAGEVMTIESKDVVPGDVLLLAAGDKVTADGRIYYSQAFEVNEAALTGESTAVNKSKIEVGVGAQVGDQTSMVFAGTVVVGGVAEVVIVGTGVHTEIGRISDLVADVEDEKTPLQKQLDTFAKIIGIAVAIIAFVVFMIGIARGIEATEMFQISVALAVAAVPEGLVVGMTVILAIGMQRILKRGALVRRLVASETLGSVSVICVDKTGTLTTGEMSLDEVVVDGKELYLSDDDERIEALKQGLYFTSSVVVSNEKGETLFKGSQTEVAIMRGLESHLEDIKASAEVVHELPFDSKRKYAAVIVRTDRKLVMYAVGAPDILINRCDLSDGERMREETVLEDLTDRGLRSLIVVSREDGAIDRDMTDKDVNDMSVVGYVGLRDPLRKGIASVIEEARGAGLRPIMITGDHPKTAKIIATEAGLAKEDSRVVTGVELDEISDQELAQQIDEINVYARVMPRHKLRIVRAWQARGKSVAMTGDGVNDAPAIKAADIGIAVGSGTEVAKETADMVLLKNNFKTIVAAIREGRIILDNIRKVIVYLLSDSFSEVILVTISLLLGLPLPILPAQILWINLITDGFPSIALTFEPGEKNIMKEPPRKKNEKLLNQEMKVLIFIVGIAQDLLLFAVYFYLLSNDVHIDEVRTFIFAKLGLDSLVYVFSIRKFRSSVFKNNPFENKWLIGGVGIGLVMQLLPLTYAPLRDLFNFTALTLVEWAIVVGLSFLTLLIIEAVKALYNRRLHREEAIS